MYGEIRNLEEPQAADEGAAWHEELHGINGMLVSSPSARCLNGAAGRLPGCFCAAQGAVQLSSDIAAPI